MKKHKHILPYHKTLPKFNGGGILSGQSVKYSQNPTKAAEMDKDGDGVIGINELGNINPNLNLPEGKGHDMLDTTSWIDPTPISDWSNASAYLAEGDKANAALYGAMGFLPSVLGKVAKKPLTWLTKKIFKNNVIENTVKQNVKQVIPDWSTGVTNYNPKDFLTNPKIKAEYIKSGKWSEARKNALLNMKDQGKYLDDIGFDAKTLKGENIVFHGVSGGRSLVEVALPNGRTQLMYKSTDMSGKGVGDLWQPYGGHSYNQYWDDGVLRKSDNWFIKDGGYENFYDSKSYKDIATSLDQHMVEQAWDMSDQVIMKNIDGNMVKTFPYAKPKEFGGERTTALRNFMYDEKRDKPFANIGMETMGTEIDAGNVRNNMLDDQTKSILNKIETDWNLKDQEKRNNVTSNQTNQAEDFITNANQPIYMPLSKYSESITLGTEDIDNPFRYISYGNKNKNSDTNKKYVDNIILNNDIQKVKQFDKEADLTLSTYEGEENWDNYNFADFNDVVKIQKELVNNGYDIGDYNNNYVDKTIELKYKDKGIDAKFGNKTKKAWFDFQLNKLNLQNKKTLTASYYSDLKNSNDSDWKFNKKASKGEKFNYSNAINTKYNQSERINWIESFDGVLSKNERDKTEEILNFMDTVIPQLANDMLIEADHNWISNTVYGMVKENIPINLDKINPEVLKYFDIDKTNIQEDDKKLALLTAYNVMNNYSKIKQHLSENPNEDIKEEEIRDMATFRLGKKYSDRRNDEYTDEEILKHQLITANNLTRILEGESPSNRNKILSTDNAQEIMNNAQNALNISSENSESISPNISTVKKNIKDTKLSTVGGEIEIPKYKGKYAKYGYEYDNQKQAEKTYKEGGDIDPKLEKALLGKGWIKKREEKETKKPDWSKIPPHIMINSIDTKFMKRGGNYPDMKTKIKIYDDYLNGIFDNMDNQDHKNKAKKIVNKLNRFYMYDARENRQHVFDYMKAQLDKLKNK